MVLEKMHATELRDYLSILLEIQGKVNLTEASRRRIEAQIADTEEQIRELEQA